MRTTDLVDRSGRPATFRVPFQPTAQPPSHHLCADRKRLLLRGGIPQNADENLWQSGIWAHRAERRKADDRRG